MIRLLLSVIKFVRFEFALWNIGPLHFLYLIVSFTTMRSIFRSRCASAPDVLDRYTLSTTNFELKMRISAAEEKQLS